MPAAGLDHRAGGAEMAAEAGVAATACSGRPRRCGWFGDHIDGACWRLVVAFTQENPA